VRVKWIPSGDAGARATVREMVRLARTPSRDVARMAAYIRGDTPRGSLTERLALWITVVTSYVPDPWGVEVLATPALMIREIERYGSVAGDCDDIATLTAAMALALEIPARYVLVRGPSGAWAHVYAEVWDVGVGAWRTVDPTPGERPENPVTETVDVDPL